MEKFAKEMVMMHQFPKISEIHSISVHGKLPQSHLETLRKLEELTTQEEWNGLKGIYCTDFVIPQGAMGSYVCSSDDRNKPVEITVTFKNGSKGKIELLEKQLPAIVLSSFNDEYSFAITTIHELGHHANEDNNYEEYLKNQKEREINAHLYALTKISRKEFKPKREPNFYYWEDAKSEYIKSFGYDDHVIGEYTLLDYLIEKTNEIKVTVKAIDWNLPKLIHNRFSKSINFELLEPKKQKKSPWRVEPVLQ